MIMMYGNLQIDHYERITTGSWAWLFPHSTLPSGENPQLALSLCGDIGHFYWLNPSLPLTYFNGHLQLSGDSFYGHVQWQSSRVSEGTCTFCDERCLKEMV